MTVYFNPRLSEFVNPLRDQLVLLFGSEGIAARRATKQGTLKDAALPVWGLFFQDRDETSASRAGPVARVNVVDPAELWIELLVLLVAKASQMAAINADPLVDNEVDRADGKATYCAMHFTILERVRRSLISRSRPEYVKPVVTEVDRAGMA